MNTTIVITKEVHELLKAQAKANGQTVQGLADRILRGVEKLKKTS